MLISSKSVLNFVVKQKRLVPWKMLQSLQFQNCSHEACFGKGLLNKHCNTWVFIDAVYVY
jgi:hypothetical protein